MISLNDFVSGGLHTRLRRPRDAIPKARELATAEFATLRLRLLKIAARVVETTSRILSLLKTLNAGETSGFLWLLKF